MRGEVYLGAIESVAASSKSIWTLWSMKNGGMEKGRGGYNKDRESRNKETTGKSKKIYFGGRSITLLEGSQASPVRPYKRV